VSDESVAIRVMSFNVCGLPSRLAPLSERATHFCRHIDGSDIDVVNLQEVWGRRTLALIRTHLPSYPFVAWRRGLAGQPAGGLVTLSRRPFGAVSYTSFRGARSTVGGVAFRAKCAINSMMQGVLTVELAGLGTVIANTHLTANRDGDWSAGNRHHALQRTQLGMLHTVLARARTVGTQRMIVSGDFNVASDSPLYPMIIGGGAWRDPFAATDPVTYHLAFLPSGSTPHRIDYLLVHGDTATSAVIDSELLFVEPLALPDGRRMYLSDHVALTARIASPPA